MVANSLRMSRWVCRQMKWIDWGFRPHLCTYRLNWARRTFWGWWDEWDYTGDLRPSRLPLDHGGSPQYWIFTRETWRLKWGSNPRSPTFQAGSFNHCTRAPAICRQDRISLTRVLWWLLRCHEEHQSGGTWWANGRFNFARIQSRQ